MRAEHREILESSKQFCFQRRILGRIERGAIPIQRRVWVFGFMPILPLPPTVPLPCKQPNVVSLFTSIISCALVHLLGFCFKLGYSRLRVLDRILTVPSIVLFCTEMSDVVRGICWSHSLSLRVTAVMIQSFFASFFRDRIFCKSTETQFEELKTAASELLGKQERSKDPSSWLQSPNESGLRGVRLPRSMTSCHHRLSIIHKPLSPYFICACTYTRTDTHTHKVSV